MTKNVFGLSGGIGSGKSTVAGMLQKKYANIVIFDCDKEAKKIAKSDEIKSKLEKILNNENEKNIFEDETKKKAVEKLIHPKVWQKLNQLSDKLSKEKIILVESAILFDVGKNKDMFKNIVTVCSLAERKKRIKERNNWSDKEIALRIKNQMSQNSLKKKADVIIDTECSLKELENKTEKLYQYLINTTKEKLFW